MARTARHSKKELREMALQAARAAITDEGSRDLTARGVARRMGYSVGTIYNIFEGLEELVASLNAQTLDALHEALSQAPVTGRPEEDLHRLLDLYLEFIATHRSEWNMLFDERLPGAEGPPEWYLEKVRNVFSLLAPMMRPLFAPGEEAELGRAVRLLWIGLHGLWTLAADGKLYMVADDPMEKLAHDMLALQLAGIRARKG